MRFLVIPYYIAVLNFKESCGRIKGKSVLLIFAIIMTLETCLQWYIAIACVHAVRCLQGTKKTGYLPEIALLLICSM